MSKPIFLYKPGEILAEDVEALKAEGYLPVPCGDFANVKIITQCEQLLTESIFVKACAHAIGTNSNSGSERDRFAASLLSQLTTAK